MLFHPSTASYAVMAMTNGKLNASAAEQVAVIITNSTCRKCTKDEFSNCLVPSLGLLTKKPYDLSGISNETYQAAFYGKMDKVKAMDLHTPIRRLIAIIGGLLVAVYVLPYTSFCFLSIGSLLLS